MSTRIIFLVITLLLLAFLGMNCFFTVQPNEVALLLRLGKIELDHQGHAKIFTSGLHTKLPVINTVYKFDMRLQNLDAESPRMLTREQKYLYVDYYAKWKITNIALYYTRTGGSLDNAKTLLTQKVNDAIRREFGKRTLQEVISDDRLKIMSSLQHSINASANHLGIQVIDVRIQSIDLLKQVLQSVFQRMSTKREQVATEYRADGQAQAEKIRSMADADAQKIIAEASRVAALTRASGDSRAAAIYLQTYNQDPDFYAFYRSLQAYRHVFNPNTVMVLRPSSEFFKYFNQPQSK